VNRTRQYSRKEVIKSEAGLDTTEDVPYKRFDRPAVVITPFEDVDGSKSVHP
jgi:hypothetical protein